MQGRDEETARRLIQDAKEIEQSGAFAVVLECVPAQLAEIITKSLSIPTIGIGAGAGCDGQVLVYQDMLGIYNEVSPKFVKRYADAGKVMEEGIKRYLAEVKDGSFPSRQHIFNIDRKILDNL